MVKSNKFDYTGRSSSGPKLGKIVAADLVKRADKKTKEAQKAATKSTKPHLTPSRSGKKDVDKSRDGDADHEVHKLDLKVPGKALGDEGFILLCDGLEDALTSCQDLALVELNVTGNNLTTRSLARLAPIIDHAKFNLQSLDLSHNDFQVTDTASAQDWECFLAAFRHCMTLRRIDLSDNPSLGALAFEVLARVYSLERPVDPLSASGSESIIALSDEDVLNMAAEFKDNQRHDTPDEDNYLPRGANGKTIADTQILGYRRGLRSVPYITLTNVGLTDTGALFLSYVLEQHYYPTQLISETNAVEATNVCSTYRQDGNINGINWDNNNDTLGKDGAFVLKCAERLRAKQVEDDCDSFAGSAYELVRPPDSQEHLPHRKSHVSNGHRTSSHSQSSTEYGTQDKIDIVAARKKIQRNTIVNSGSRSVELWQAGLKAITLSRLLFVIAPVPRNDGLSSWTTSAAPSPEEGLLDESSLLDVTHCSEDLETSLRNIEIGDHPPKEHLKQRDRPSYAATLATTSSLASEEPMLAMTEATTKPQFPIVQTGFKSLSAIRKDSGSLDKHDKGKKQSSSSLDAEILSLNPGMSASYAETSFSHTEMPTSHAEDAETPRAISGPFERVDCEAPFLKFQRQRMEELRDEHGGQSNGYRDVSQRCQLPLPVCVQVLGHAMDARLFSILKPDQQRGAVAWGQKRSTLNDELEWRSKDESYQILSMLSKANCVEF